MPTDNSRDLTPKQVAARLNVSIETIYRHLRSGALESYRLAGPKGSYRVTERSVEAFKWKRN